MTITANPGERLAAEEAAGFGHAGWTRRKPGEPLASWAVRNAIAYLGAGLAADLDAAGRGDPGALERAGDRIIRMSELAAWIPPEFRGDACGINDLGGQDPYPRYGRADYDNGIDTWDATEGDADDG